MASGLTRAVRVAQILGITSAAWLSGYIASMSIAGVPAVREAGPSVAPKQWRTIFDIGIRTSPAIALTSASSFAYCAFQISRLPPPITGTERNSIYLFSAAAVSVVLIVPWTQLAMLGTNAELDAKVTDNRNGQVSEPKTDPELDSMLKRWAELNAVRAVFPVVGALTGLWAALA